MNNKAWFALAVAALVPVALIGWFVANPKHLSLRGRRLHFAPDRLQPVRTTRDARRGLGGMVRSAAVAGSPFGCYHASDRGIASEVGAIYWN